MYVTVACKILQLVVSQTSLLNEILQMFGQIDQEGNRKSLLENEVREAEQTYMGQSMARGEGPERHRDYGPSQYFKFPVNLTLIICLFINSYISYYNYNDS